MKFGLFHLFECPVEKSEKGILGEPPKREEQPYLRIAAPFWCWWGAKPAY
jgi:hypothetical protein